MDRRTFLHTSTITLGGTAMLGFSASASDADAGTSRASSAPSGRAASGGTGIGSVGVQLYTVRTLLEDDFEGTITQIAEMGYDKVEFAGFYGHAPEEVKALVNRLGLGAPAGHLLPDDIRKRPDEILHAAQTLGYDYLVCAYLTEKDRGSLEAYRNVASLLENFGKRCADAGVQLAYHNHDFEFQSIDGTLPYDVLLQETSPETVKMELDLYWIRKAGHDPLAYFDAHAGRFPLWHVKDMGADGGMTPVGEGQMDFAALFEQAEQAGLQHAFVEHDNPEDPMQSIQTSLAYLQQLGES